MMVIEVKMEQAGSGSTVVAADTISQKILVNLHGKHRQSVSHSMSILRGHLLGIAANIHMNIMAQTVFHCYKDPPFSPGTTHQPAELCQFPSIPFNRSNLEQKIFHLQWLFERKHMIMLILELYSFADATDFTHENGLNEYAVVEKTHRKSVSSEWNGLDVVHAVVPQSS